MTLVLSVAHMLTLLLHLRRRHCRLVDDAEGQAQILVYYRPVDQNLPKVPEHEVRDQDLLIERAPGICQLDVR